MTNEQLQELKKIVQEENIFFNEPMSKHTTFRIGGLAQCYIKIAQEDELIKILEFVQKENIKITIVGNGSNILVSDNGIKGITLKIEINDLEITKNEKDIFVNAGSGNIIPALAYKLLEDEVSGFEFASGIPATIGGAIRMNAGAHGKEMKDIVQTINTIDLNGNRKEFTNEEAEFNYRTSIFADGRNIILSAVLKLEKGNKEEIKQKMDEYANMRKTNQPIEFPSVGSTFKRGNDFITAKLIEECGLKGYTIGGATVSTKHAGFVINKGDATAKDVLELTKYIEDTVYEKFNKKIDLEMILLGEF